MPALCLEAAMALRKPSLQLRRKASEPDELRFLLLEYRPAATRPPREEPSPAASPEPAPPPAAGEAERASARAAPEAAPPAAAPSAEKPPVRRSRFALPRLDAARLPSSLRKAAEPEAAAGRSPLKPGRFARRAPRPPARVEPAEADARAPAPEEPAPEAGAARAQPASPVEAEQPAPATQVEPAPPQMDPQLQPPTEPAEPAAPHPAPPMAVPARLRVDEERLHLLVDQLVDHKRRATRRDARSLEQKVDELLAEKSRPKEDAGAGI